MTHYSLQPRNQVFVKSFEFFCFGKNMCKNVNKNLGSEYNQKDALKTASKWAIQKTTKATVDSISNKLLIKLQKGFLKILYRQLKVKQKYQKRDIYLNKKDSKLLMN